MGLNELLVNNPNQTLSYLEDPKGKEFNEVLRSWLEHENRKLRTSDNDVDIFRAQGAAKVLTAILALPEDIRQYLHDVSIGKRKKIEPQKEIQHGMAR